MKVTVKQLRVLDLVEGAVNNDMLGYLELDAEYLVYGLTVKKSINYVQIFDGNNLISVPLNLFVITDSRISKFWEIKKQNDDTLTLWPKEFYAEYFHDDLSEGVQEVVDSFKKVRKEIELESSVIY